MPERRVSFGFGINYATNAEVVARIQQIVRLAIESCDKTRFDRAHFKGFGTNALEFEVVYFVVNSDFNLYMNIQQSVNLYLMKEFEAIGVRFAFPAMTLNMPPDLTPSMFEEKLTSSKPKHSRATNSVAK